MSVIESNETESMLTTVDNPFDPFTQFDEWYQFDIAKGYYTCSLLGRIAKTSSELSEADNHLAIEEAIKEIIVNDPTKIYKRVTKELVNE